MKQIHCLAVPHTVSNDEHVGCAFTQKVRKFLTMFRNSFKYRTIHYGHPDSVTDAHEHVDVITSEVQEEAYGRYDFKESGFKYGTNDVCINTFNKNVGEAIRARKQKGDIVLAFWGATKAACDIANRDGDLIIVEPGIGCGWAFAQFRLYESYPLKSAFMGTNGVTYCDPKWYWRVVPNYFNVSDFESKQQREPYAVYIGRIGTNKGVHIAIDACARMGIKLVIAGQGTAKDIGLNEWPEHVEYLGYADPALRKKLFSEASFGFLLSTYWEPFGGTAVEMMLSGCVPICSDSGAMTEYVVDGTNGFRCNTMGDILRAIRLVPTIRRDRMVQFARDNFSLAAVRPRFERAFDDFDDIWTGKGWYEDHNRTFHASGLDFRALYAPTVTHTPDDFEKSFWGDCTNTNAEEVKQFVYARLMGLAIGYHCFGVPVSKIADIGGGPTSMLLKCGNVSGSVVVDPLGYPDWVVDRYAAKGIQYVQSRGEDWEGEGFDEVWIYNCLQHTDDPEKIIKNALKAAPVLRIFEWIDFPPHPGHPQELKKQKLEEWIGKIGSTCTLNESGCFGNAFYGVFRQ
jgi:glycosyltransferase involved in cell wall biosynthesis